MGQRVTRIGAGEAILDEKSCPCALRQHLRIQPFETGLGHGLIDWPPLTVDSVASSRTMNLSLGERPVNCPVCTTYAPPVSKQSLLPPHGVLQQLRGTQIPVRSIDLRAMAARNCFVSMTFLIVIWLHEAGLGALRRLFWECASAHPGQVIEFESNGLKYQTLTKRGVTVMYAHLAAHMHEFSILQVAVSNGSPGPYTIRPEDFTFVRGGWRRDARVGRPESWSRC